VLPCDYPLTSWMGTRRAENQRGRDGDVPLGGDKARARSAGASNRRRGARPRRRHAWRTPTARRSSSPAATGRAVRSLRPLPWPAWSQTGSIRADVIPAEGGPLPAPKPVRSGLVSRPAERSSRKAAISSLLRASKRSPASAASSAFRIPRARAQTRRRSITGRACWNVREGWRR